MDLSQFTSYIQLLSSFLVALTGLTAALCALVRPIRRWFSRMFSKMKADERLETAVEKIAARQEQIGDRQEQIGDRQVLMQEAIQTITRNALTDIWHRVEPQGYICDWDRENFLKMYAAYSAIGGNSYVHSIYELISKMPSLPPKKTRATRKKKKG